LTYFLEKTIIFEISLQSDNFPLAFFFYFVSYLEAIVLKYKKVLLFDKGEKLIRIIQFV